MRKLKSLLFTTLFATVLVSASCAQEANYRFHKVFFYSFTKYVQWPANYNDGDFVIGVFGDSDITPLLQEMAEIKKVGNNKIVIKTISADKLTEKLNILFVPHEKIRQFAVIKEGLLNKPTLLITETPEMASNGSMINFKDVSGKLRFEVNTTLIVEKGLKVSQELVRFGDEIK
jgi:hypothetical protein